MTARYSHAPSDAHAVLPPPPRTCRCAHAFDENRSRRMLAVHAAAPLMMLPRRSRMAARERRRAMWRYDMRRFMLRRAASTQQ